MFANRVSALTDACVLAPPLKRNILLSLAEAEFFRICWSREILDETERAIHAMLAKRGEAEANHRAARARAAMERAFEEATIEGHQPLMSALQGLPDPGDAHVIAAAVKARASVIVSDKLRHFPEATLRRLDLEVKTADAFIADTIDLDPGRAVAAIRRMRERFNRPEKDAGRLLLDMGAAGLTQTVDGLRVHERAL